MAVRDPAWDELSLLQNTSIRIWQSYMRWFSWHFVVHLGALGTVFTNVALRQHSVKVAIFMGVFSSLGVGAAACMCVYDYKVRKQVENLRSAPIANSALFGGDILRFARWACLVTKILLVGTWIAVGLDASTASILSAD